MFKKSGEKRLEELRGQLKAAEGELEGANAAYDRVWDRLYVEVPRDAEKAERGWKERDERPEVRMGIAERIRGDAEQAKLEFQAAVDQVTRARGKCNDLAARVSALDSSLNWEDRAHRQGRAEIAAMAASTRSKAVRHG